MIRPWAQVLFVAVLPAAAWASSRVEPLPPLAAEHRHPSGAFTFRTPADWVVASSPTDPNAVEAGSGDYLVRFIYKDSEQGYDIAHDVCMLERLASDKEQALQVKYEYDFLSGLSGPHRVLDSAFIVTYLKPIRSYTQWRQRNVTLVGAGHTICAISYVPLPVFKKSKTAKALLDGVLGSLVFQ